MKPIDPSRRCTAHNKAGNQCAVAAIKGGSVCRTHGGSAPQVKAKAAERLAILIDPSLPLVAQRIKQGLYAMETKLFQKDGIVTDKRNLVSWSERREYAELAMKALGISISKDSDQDRGPIEVIIRSIGAIETVIKT
jgi:hypothetical protein